MNNLHNNNRMYYNSNNNNHNNNNNNQSQQQQQSHSHVHQSQQQQQQQQQQQLMQQYNEQMYAQMQQNINYNHSMHQIHQQTSGIVPPPPGLSFIQQGGYSQNSYSHYPQQAYQGQQQQNNLINQSHHMQQQGSPPQQNQQQGNGQSFQQHQQSSQQQLQTLSQSPLQSNQQQQQQQQIQNSSQQQQGQQKIGQKLQKQYSLMDDRITQASEEDRSISSYQPIQQIISNGQEEFLLEHLELSIFKINPCPNQNVQHNHKQCQHYHGLKDRRRIGTNYSHDPCQFIDSFGANCPLGDKCGKSHNKVEQLYRPDKYKTKFCTYYPNNCKSCEYGIFCSFAHSENDINTELIHNYEYDVDFYIFYYKTVWCPFNYINHDRGMCVYAHNWQDYRRKPHSVEFGYEPDGCESWDPNSFITEYEIGCPNKQNCKRCHGWKELEYHPKIYRTKPCQQQPCPKGKACPYYHNVSEKRNLSGNIQSELFRYAPRNRITKGLFKISQHLIPKEIKQHQQQQQGGGSNQLAGNGNGNSSSKLAQFGSSHSLSSQNNNQGGNYQSQYDSIQTQTVKKQASLNSKKQRGNNILMKMNTCNDLSSNLHEDSIEAERQFSQFQSVYQEKIISNIVHSPPLKKLQSSNNNIINNNSGSGQHQQFNRCENQQADEKSALSSTPQHLPGDKGQEEQKKTLKMAVPFVLEEQTNSAKKINPNDSMISNQNSSANKFSNHNQSSHSSIQQQNSQEYATKDQLDQILSDHFDNPFTPQTQNPGLQRQGTSSSSQGVVVTNQPNLNNFNSSIPTNNLPPNQNFQAKSGTYSKQNSIQSISNTSCSNLDNIQKQIIDKQNDEDYDQINALIKQQH